MNLVRVALAFLGASVAYFACGFLLFAALPAMKTEFLKFPGVYRSNDSMMKAMPYDMGGILVSILVVTILYAKMYPVGGGLIPGLYVGALLGIFAVCTFVVHSYVLLNISPRLAVYQGVTYFIQWAVTGAAIGLIYKPA